MTIELRVFTANKAIAISLIEGIARLMVCIPRILPKQIEINYQNLVFVEIPISKAIPTESVQQAKMR